MDNYSSDLKKAKNVVLIKQLGVPVNQLNQVRIKTFDSGGKITVFRKKLFERVINKEQFEKKSLDDVHGSLLALYSTGDEFAPLKIINTTMKEWKKKQLPFVFEYVGWWFDKSWQDKGYVTDLANLPSKEELIGKLMFLLKYPAQSLVMVLDQIVKKSMNN